MIKKIFQTVEDRDNPDHIEKSGPFVCNRTDAWLGLGAYFWESFVENAHWWGAKSYPKGYVICESQYEVDDIKCLDLVDNYEHLSCFNKAITMMAKENLYKDGFTTVARVIEFLRSIDMFPFYAARVKGDLVKSKQNSDMTIPFNKSDSYLDLYPPVQICFYSSNKSQISGYKIIYPLEYVEGCAV